MQKLTAFEAGKRNESISGKIPLLLLWLVGIPVPILVIIFLLRGCT